MTTPQALNTYLNEVQREFTQAEAREHAYRHALKALLEAPGDVHAINDAARIKDVGAPDFIIKRDNIPVAFAEAKDIGVDLNKVEKSQQFQGYLKALPNLLLTDYLEFRWYYKGEFKDSARLASKSGKKLNPDDGGVVKVAVLLDSFAVAQTPTVNTAQELAQYMAGMARNIARLIENYLPESETLKAQKDAFEQTLVPNLAANEFADMYAQTLAYGLFAARVGYSGKAEEFTLEKAFFNIPKTNPFLKKFFQEIAPDLDDKVRWQVDTLALLLAHADTDEILKDFGKKTRQDDPVVHFYETFLKAYDSDIRDTRGVYYTPEPVVNYIVRSVDHLLKTRFNRADGLADTNTYILDPATGTGTFLYFVIQQIYDSLGGMRGMWDSYVRDHLLKRVFGFELLMAPYAVAHMKLGILLKDLGYKFENNQRLGVYLTNTLEEQVKAARLPGMEFLSDEAREAITVKHDQPIMVVLGNPPYSGHSANRSKDSSGKRTRIGELLQTYYEVDGKPLGERNPKWLQDDYVKFIRFGQERIRQTGHGILAFVTNHGYLDNPTFRGMRQQLMQEFDEIYVLNLHGNSKKKEKAPDGGKDENVFDIQQGVAIGLFVKLPQTDSVAAPQNTKVYHADLYGLRESKYEALKADDAGKTAWQTIQPQTPFYLFEPQNLDMNEEYQQGWKTNDIFGTGNNRFDSGKQYSLGIITHNDQLHIDWTQEELIKRVNMLADKNISNGEILKKLPVEESNYWDTEREREKVRNSDWRAKIQPIYYRPFDWRYIYYEPRLMDIGRGGSSKTVMQRAKKSQINLMVSKGYEVENFEHVLVSDQIAVHHAATRKEGNYFFPLYLNPDSDSDDINMFSHIEGEWAWSAKGRRPNLSPKFVRALEAKLQLKFAYDVERETGLFMPEDVFAYTYAVFHSPEYRSRYAEFLKIDFPRLPLTGDVELFWSLVGYGNQLVDAHLLRGQVLSLPGAGFPERGDSKVEAKYPDYQENEQRVYINKTQYFAGVEPEVWAFQIGGYQVLEKWLKDRRGRTLSFDDVRHYGRVVTALRETIRLMAAIDDAIPGFPLM